MPFVAVVREKPGVLRRRIEISTRPGAAVAALEDDFHCFRVTVEHEDSRVTMLRGEGARTPWSSCGDAGRELTKLVGMRLDADAGAALAVTDIRHQCTHMFDLAGLAIAMAAKQRPFRRYEIVVADPVDDVVEASVARDDGLELRWRVKGTTILAPDPWSGLVVKKDFLEWLRRNADAETLEAAMVLRRGLMVAGGRRFDLDSRDSAAESPNAGACYAMQPVRSALGRRNFGNTRDFTDRPGELLGTFRDR